MIWVLKWVWALRIHYLENHLLAWSSSVDLLQSREGLFTFYTQPLEVCDRLWLSVDLECVLVLSPGPLKLEHLVGERHVCTLKPPTLITKLPQQDPTNEIKTRTERKIELYSESRLQTITGEGVSGLQPGLWMKWWWVWEHGLYWFWFSTG